MFCLIFCYWFSRNKIKTDSWTISWSLKLMLKKWSSQHPTICLNVAAITGCSQQDRHYLGQSLGKPIKCIRSYVYLIKTLYISLPFSIISLTYWLVITSAVATHEHYLMHGACIIPNVITNHGNCLKESY